MATQYIFTHQLPLNSGKLKKAFISLVALIIVCILAMVVSEIFWDQYTHQAYKLRCQCNVTVGWPATVFNWSLWLAVAAVLSLPMMYFMQDFKNPSLALTKDSLFINQQLMRNTIVPFSNISRIVKDGKGYRILFKDNAQVVKQQVFLFKPFVKSNLATGNFLVSDIHTSGNVDALFEELQKHMPKPD